TRTESGQYRFIAKEDADGRPRLVLEPKGEPISAFGDAVLGLDLRDSVTYAHAQQIAEILNDQVTGMSGTHFDEKADG
ncbi:hypothetical protein MKL09_02100, partial [Methylobacterium sp. J-048]|uniref:hypothetical protein n=1 Tax=Methylobacterium sp. J-048 TaxID=2836635 RepID=UPI001FBBAF62